MRQLARYVRSKDMYVFFSYGGEERLNDDIYCNPVWLKEMLTNLAKESIGFMPWRRTSLHLWYPDKAWQLSRQDCVRRWGRPLCRTSGTRACRYPHRFQYHPEWKWSASHF